MERNQFKSGSGVGGHVDFLHKHDILQIKEKSGKATTANLNRRIWLKVKKYQKWKVKTR